MRRVSSVPTSVCVCVCLWEGSGSDKTVTETSSKQSWRPQRDREETFQVAIAG